MRGLNLKRQYGIFAFFELAISEYRSSPFLEESGSVRHVHEESHDLV